VSFERAVRAAGPPRVIGVIAICAWASSARAQEADAGPPEPAAAAAPTPAADAADRGDLEDRIEQLTEKVEELTEENQDLQADIDDLFKQQQTPRKEPIRLNLMNPPITVFANMAARVDSDPVMSAGGERIDDKIFLRTAEVDFRAAIDPYADGVLILAMEDEAGTGFEADLEEVYLILKRLPIAESAPLGLKLKLGRFRAPLGSVNRLHMHDLPWTTRPLPIAQYLGTEQGSFFESGFNPEGLDAELFLPTIIPGAVMELNLDVLDAGDIALTEGNGGQEPAGLGHYNLFFTVADAHDFNLGLSAYYEGGDRPVALYSADFLYKWKPLEQGEFHSFVLGGEAFYADRKFAIDTDDDGIPDTDAHTNPFAAFGFAQYQLTWHTYVGGRYDYVRHIDDDDLATQVAAAYVSYYTSEFLRFRLGYEYQMSDIPALDGVSTGIAEVNFVLGSHPTEPYWVNR